MVSPPLALSGYLCPGFGCSPSILTSSAWIPHFASLNPASRLRSFLEEMGAPLCQGALSWGPHSRCFPHGTLTNTLIRPPGHAPGESHDALSSPAAWLPGDRTFLLPQLHVGLPSVAFMEGTRNGGRNPTAVPQVRSCNASEHTPFSIGETQSHCSPCPPPACSFWGLSGCLSPR